MCVIALAIDFAESELLRCSEEFARLCAKVDVQPVVLRKLLSALAGGLDWPLTRMDMLVKKNKAESSDFADVSERVRALQGSIREYVALL